MRDQIEARDRDEDRAVRAAAGGHAVRVHPDRELAVGAAGAVHRRTAGRPSCSSRRPRTSTSCWRWRCSCSSATTRPASGAAASGPPASSCSRATSRSWRRSTSSRRLAKPISLSLRLFGNIFAGGILVALIALFPPYIMWAPNAIWKSVRPVRRRDPGVHLRAADHLVLQPVDGAGRGPRLKRP